MLTDMYRNDCKDCPALQLTVPASSTVLVTYLFIAQKPHVTNTIDSLRDAGDCHSAVQKFQSSSAQSLSRQ